ncbi:MAG TPA: hypothetical protein VKE22_20675 [Haliangiales bacterium]|nr:hypothetical protein [Haliangiales bacterium]
MTLGEAAARRLRARAPLPVDPARPIAVKRNVHEATIGADADAFAAAFRAVLAGDDDFGAIRVKRLPGRDGSAFVVGERFAGAVSLAALGLRLPARVAEWLEDRFLSDYAELVELGPRSARYVYLSGAPLAGQSTFVVQPDGPGRCRFVQTFEYQEVGPAAIFALHLFGVRAHDGITAEQLRRAAARVGAPILSSTLRAG